jgi:mxaK protein
MRQAVLIRTGEQPGQAIPLIELAKESYRELLRAEPSDWGARYNLERAQRLLPDPYENETPPSEPPSNAERAATTMRGFSPGMP